jgi:membrane protease YdiL (CAAX protease family)
MREPDAQDAARVLALGLLAMAAALGLVWLGCPGWVAGVFQQLAFLAAPLAYARAARLRPFAASGFSPLPLRTVVYVLIASLGSFWILYGLQFLQMDVIRAVGYEKQAQLEEQQITQSIQHAQESGVAPALTLLVLIPPLCEETFFRGILFRGLLPRFGLKFALPVTTILFAVLHPAITQKGLMLFLGAYLGLLVYLTGSLWASMLAHAVNNFAVVAMMWAFGGELPTFTAPWWMYVLSVVVFGLGMTMLALDRPPRAVRE